MQKASFEEFKDTKLISYPSSEKEVQMSAEESEFFCEECNENAEAPEQNIFSEDFVWHPSEKY